MSNQDAVIQLADGRHLNRFRNAPLSSVEELDTLGRELCLGMARLEDLPLIAFDSRYLENGAPLRITRALRLKVLSG
ncbi:MAG: hypothetical protein IPL99_26340 [Candidatus Competibacteraceae bacterium]|nr:hypothetical protein [Candidatus Competibacteraceae bacterium]